MDYPKERDLLAQHARNRSLVIFVGAGVSQNAGLPGWKEMLKTLSEALNVPSNADILDLPQWYADAKGEGALWRQVIGQLAKVSEPGPLHKAIARIPVPVLFTTNYDQLLEIALEREHGTPPDVIIEDPHVAVIDETQRTTVLKLHGCMTVPDTIVLSRDQYDAYDEHHHAMTTYFQSLLATRTFLFVGSSLTDPNFRRFYNAIMRSLGRLRGSGETKFAYVLKDPPSKQTAEAFETEYWRRRGIITLEVEREQQAEFLVDIANAAVDVGPAKAPAVLGCQEPPPALDTAGMEQHLAGLALELGKVVQQAMLLGLLSAMPSGAVDSGVAGDPGHAPSADAVRRKVRSLLELALAVGQLTNVGIDPDVWIRIGDALYLQRDTTGAIRAYQRVLRPHVDSALAPGVFLHVLGNLARAYAKEEHYGRAESLLRRCVFHDEGVIADDKPSRHTVADRLNMEHLKNHPWDASEFVYCVNRHVERIAAKGREHLCSRLLDEARYALEPLLGVPWGSASVPSQDLFTSAQQTWSARSSERSRSYSARQRGGAARAYALNHLGKCYRLRRKAALELGQLRRASTFLSRSLRCFREASMAAPELPSPYAHRLLIYAHPSLPSGESQSILKDVLAALDAPGAPAAEVRDDILRNVVAEWKKSSTNDMTVYEKHQRDLKSVPDTPSAARLRHILQHQG